MPTALIVEDEPVLATELREELARLWPELTLFAPVHDGVAALREIEARRPDILFLDVQIPGLTGIEVARVAGARSHVVFITAFDQYAVQAFEQGAVDYLLKPIETARLAQAIGRVRARLQQPPADLSTLLEQLQRGNGSERLQWITVLQGRDILHCGRRRQLLPRRQQVHRRRHCDGRIADHHTAEGARRAPRPGRLLAGPSRRRRQHARRP